MARGPRCGGERGRRGGRLGGEPVGVAPAVTFEKAVGLHFPDVVPELVEPIEVGIDAVADEDGLVNVLGARAADLRSGVEQDLHEADHSGVMDLDSGKTSRTDDEGEGETLEEREVDVCIEPSGLKLRESIGDGEKGRPHLV